MIAALALTGATLFIATGLVWTARLIHIGNLDALALAEKLSVPYPDSAADWPELHIRAVIPQPGLPSVLLLVVARPHYPQQATLLMACDGVQPLGLVSRWCATSASISPRSMGDDHVELRRRQSLERVCGRLLAEEISSDLSSKPPASPPRVPRSQ